MASTSKSALLGLIGAAGEIGSAYAQGVHQSQEAKMADERRHTALLKMEQVRVKNQQAMAAQGFQQQQQLATQSQQHATGLAEMQIAAGDRRHASTIANNAPVLTDSQGGVSLLNKAAGTATPVTTGEGDPFQAAIPAGQKKDIEVNRDMWLKVLQDEGHDMANPATARLAMELATKTDPGTRRSKATQAGLSAGFVPSENTIGKMQERLNVAIPDRNTSSKFTLPDGQTMPDGSTTVTMSQLKKIEKESGGKISVGDLISHYQLQ